MSCSHQAALLRWANKLQFPRGPCYSDPRCPTRFGAFTPGPRQGAASTVSGMDAETLVPAGKKHAAFGNAQHQQLVANSVQSAAATAARLPGAEDTRTDFALRWACQCKQNLPRVVRDAHVRTFSRARQQCTAQACCMRVRVET